MREVRHESCRAEAGVKKDMSGSGDSADNAFAALYEIFSKPIKNPQKSFRRYDLSFEKGEPVFTLSAFDREFGDLFDELFEKNSTE